MMILIRKVLAWTALTALLLAVILVPFILFGAPMDAWAASTVQTPGIRTASIFVLVVALLAADVLLPVPSSILSTLAGAVLGVPLGAAASFAGMTLGCAVGYWLGRDAGRAAAAKLVGHRELRRLDGLAARHGDWTIALCRAVPVLAEGSVIMAGVAGMPLRRVLVIGALSNLGISLAYATVGATSASVNSFLLAFVGAIVIPLAAMGLARVA